MAEVRRDMPQVLLHDCYVWLPYNLVAFRTIPTHIRPTTTALMTLGSFRRRNSPKRSSSPPTARPSRVSQPMTSRDLARISP